MALRIRLTRTGRKNAPSYRVVVSEQRKKRDGRIVELVGSYNPHLATGKKATFNSDRMKYWISKGAQPTLTVAKLFKLASKAATTPAA